MTDTQRTPHTGSTALLPSMYPSGVLLAGVVGSTAYGLATSESDVDTLGVFLTPTAQVLGLNSATATDRTITCAAPDAAFHELGKFARLALKGNPTVLELLYLPTYTLTSVSGMALVNMRDAFLSTAAVRAAYIGYAHSQASRLATRTANGKAGFGSVPISRVEKHGRHCLRLLSQGRQLLTTGAVSLDMSAQREELFAGGRLAAADPEGFAALVAEQKAALEQVDSVLPDAPNLDAVEQFLVATRSTNLHRSGW